MFEFDFDLGATAPLNWCPDCASRLKNATIVLKDGSQATCKKCNSCGYIHDLHVIEASSPGEATPVPPVDVPEIIPGLPYIPNEGTNDGPAPLPEEEDNGEVEGFLIPGF